MMSLTQFDAHAKRSGLRTWMPVQTNTLGAVPLTFTDPQPANLATRFYRLRSNP